MECKNPIQAQNSLRKLIRHRCSGWQVNTQTCFFVKNQKNNFSLPGSWESELIQYKSSISLYFCMAHYSFRQRLFYVVPRSALLFCCTQDRRSWLSTWFRQIESQICQNSKVVVKKIKFLTATFFMDYNGKQKNFTCPKGLCTNPWHLLKPSTYTWRNFWLQSKTRKV